MSGLTTLSLHHVVREPRPLVPRPPLLLLLHGVGSNERSMARIADRFDARFLVLSVRSPLVFGPDAFGWFHVTFTDDGPRIVREEAEAGWRWIARFVDEVVTAYAADRERVYLAGFSQGAIMSLATLLTAPGRVAGVAMLSGRLLPEVLPHAAPRETLRDKPVLMLHGVNDEKLGIHLARWARDRLATMPLALDYRELAIGHRISAESVGLASDWLTARLDEREEG